MRPLLLAALLLITLPSQAAAPIAPFQLEFQVSRNGSALGAGSMQLSQPRPQSWLFQSRIAGNRGLAGLAGAAVNERSTLAAPNGLLELRENRMETKIGWKTQVRSTRLDETARVYRYQDSKGEKTVPYRPGLLDQHSLTVALISDLRAGKGPLLRYPAIGKGKAEIYTFRVIGNATLDTALGRLDTVLVERIRETSNGRRTRLWFAKNRDYFPVLTREEDGSDFLEMRIVAIR